MATQKLKESPVNPFIPHMATLRDIADLTDDIKFFNCDIDDPVINENFDYKPGQFGFVSAFGEGEAPFGIASLAYKHDGVAFAIKRVGTVSNALHRLQLGDKVGVRGPFGNYFPLDEYKGKNVIIIGGGIGIAPLRPVINTIMENRDDYGDVLIVNGARSPKDLVFTSEFDTWANAPRTKLELTVDRGDDDWTGRVDLIPKVVAEISPSYENAIALVCGPPIMIKFTLAGIKELGFADEQIVTTLEGKMKCGLGKCARCNVGDKYICKDGPVFNFKQISKFIEQY
ncbi:FAD/NAD(P)-binding protein [Chloroflexota bacterium]